MLCQEFRSRLQLIQWILGQQDMKVMYELIFLKKKKNILSYYNLIVFPSQLNTLMTNSGHMTPE